MTPRAGGGDAEDWIGTKKVERGFLLLVSFVRMSALVRFSNHSAIV